VSVTRAFVAFVSEMKELFHVLYEWAVSDLLSVVDLALLTKLLLLLRHFASSVYLT